MRHPFRTYTSHIRYACETCRFRIVSFWTASEFPRERAYEETPGSDQSKFQRHNPDVLRYIILGMQLDNSGIMLPKFHSDPNQMSHH
jgi:hypothetical protein